MELNGTQAISFRNDDDSLSYLSIFSFDTQNPKIYTPTLIMEREFLLVSMDYICFNYLCVDTK